MRNNYSKEYFAWLTKYAPSHTKQQTITMSYKRFRYEISTHMMTNLLYKRGIKCLDYNIKKNHPTNQLDLFTEYVKPDGMTLIKTPSGWEYKQRYIYEQHYNVVLPTETMVIFLDGNKNNFDITNLMAVSSAEYNCARNKGLISSDGDITKTAMLASRLYYKINKLKKNA